MKSRIALISDLHLGALGKLDEFRWDDRFAALLRHPRIAPGPGDRSELVILGDAFDLWQAVPESDCEAHHASAIELRYTAEDERSRVEAVARRHPAFFAEIGRFAATPGCSVTFVPGNHDHSLVEGGVQAALRRACGRGEDPRLGFALCVDRPELGLWAEHGNQDDPNNRYSAFERFDPESECRGYPFVRLFWNRIEYLDPALQNNGSYWHAIWRHLSDRREWRIFALAIRYFRQYWNDPRVRARLTPFEAGADPRVTLDGAPTLLAEGRAAPGRLFAADAEAERLFREAYQASSEVRAEIDAACAEAGRASPGAEEVGAPVAPGTAEAILPLGPPRDVAAAGDLAAGRSSFPAKARAYDTVVTGHTHEERDLRLGSGARYLNTGAWSRGGDLPVALVECTDGGRPEVVLLHLTESGELRGRETAPAHEVSSAPPWAREAASPSRTKALALVLHAPEDEALVGSRLGAALLWSGFDRWASVPSGSPEAVRWAARSCDAVLVVVSANAARTPAVGAQAEQALAAGVPVIPVVVDETSPGKVHPGLEPLPAAHQPPLEPSRAADDDGHALADLLASIRPRSSSPAATPASWAIHPVDWNEGRFSAVLAGAVRRRDEARLQQLIAAFDEYSRVRPWPYPFEPARADLSALRDARRFRAMRRYAEAAIGSGTRDAEVRRQYGQALIELGEFGRAIGVLEAITRDHGAPAKEVREAHGLLGRAYKQMYVNAPEGAGDLLVRAIEAYRTVYDRDVEQVWHGINAASCIQRAGRDGVGTARASEAQEMADRILQTLTGRERRAPLDQWDLATRFEALALLGRSAEASAALDRYLGHPGTKAFAVTSTHRQCTEVLQLDRLPWGAPLVDRLWRMVERYRAGGLAGEKRDTCQTRPLLIRVTDPAWSPPALPGLEILSRLGTVISARGDDAAVRALLGDTEVIAVEESRPGGTCECLDSIPFVRADRVHAPPLGERGSLALVAVVDDGIDVLHQAFCDDQGRSRIEAVWDQRDPTGPAPQGFPYGTFHGPADIARYLAQGAVPPGLGRDPGGHGTHVASIAAGRAVGNFAGGVAPEARLLVVISARREVGVGFTQSYHDALAFIDGFARNRPVVVNICQGTHAGAHDGSSSLEAAFDQFTGSGLREGRIVVKSAGNDQAKGVHAKMSIGQGAVDELRWTRPAASPAPREHIELWFSSGDELAFRLVDPAGRWTDAVDVSNQVRKGVLGTDEYSAEYQKWHPNNGASQLRIDLQAAPATKLQSGDWRLEIRSASVRDGVVHAWIECDDGPPTRFALHASPDTTLSIPGTAERVITVGAVDKRDPIRLSPESSFGPTRDGRHKPDLAAPGVAILAAAAGTQAGVRPATGTSQAAPHVAGAVALLLSRRARAGLPGLTSSQIAAALRQRTRNPNVTWQATSGWGVLDAEALLMAF